MSFSSDIKKEILDNFSSSKNKECCIQAERFGEYITEVKQKKEIEEEFIVYFNISKLSECCIRAILKGVFLSSGCIVNPENDYHFEVVFKNKACAEYIQDLLSVLDFTPRILKRERINSYAIYIKEAEQISLLLSLLGASKSLLKFEGIRVEKNVKNNINRNINCETANLSKTILSSVKQIDAIKKLKKSGRFDNLNDKLKLTAYLREKYPHASLDELAKKISAEGKVSKSGIKHRLDKIIELSEEI